MNKHSFSLNKEDEVVEASNEEHVVIEALGALGSDFSTSQPPTKADTMARLQILHIDG